MRRTILLIASLVFSVTTVAEIYPDSEPICTGPPAVHNPPAECHYGFGFDFYYDLFDLQGSLKSSGQFFLEYQFGTYWDQGLPYDSDEFASAEFYQTVGPDPTYYFIQSEHSVWSQNPDGSLAMNSSFDDPFTGILTLALQANFYIEYLPSPETDNSEWRLHFLDFIVCSDISNCESTQTGTIEIYTGSGAEGSSYTLAYWKNPFPSYSSTNEVPLPTALWLFLSAISGLTAIRITNR